jgi:protein gp37
MEKLCSLKKPTGIFICSTFEWLWEEAWAHNIIGWIERYPQHRIYLLTKQPEKLERFNPFPDNCWVGVTVTSNAAASLAYTNLASIIAKVKFISFEPLQGQIGKDELRNLSQVTDWWIVGAMTPYSEKTASRIEWVREIVEVAGKAGIPVFLKNNLYPLIFKETTVSDRGKLRGGSSDELRQEIPV